MNYTDQKLQLRLLPGVVCYRIVLDSDAAPWEDDSMYALQYRVERYEIKGETLNVYATLHHNDEVEEVVPLARAKRLIQQEIKERTRYLVKRTRTHLEISEADLANSPEGRLKVEQTFSEEELESMAQHMGVGEKVHETSFTFEGKDFGVFWALKDLYMMSGLPMVDVAVALKRPEGYIYKSWKDADEEDRLMAESVMEQVTNLTKGYLNYMGVGYTQSGASKQAVYKALDWHHHEQEMMRNREFGDEGPFGFFGDDEEDF